MDEMNNRECLEDNETVFTSDLTGEEYIDTIFQMTDTENGIVYIPGWYDGFGKPHSLRCQLKNFSYRECEKAQKEYQKLVSGIKEIANFLNNHPERDTITPDDLGERIYQIWTTYVRPYNADEEKSELLFDIEDRLDTLDMIKDISRHLANDEPMSDADLQFLKEYADITVSSTERQLYRKYTESKFCEAESRVGAGYAATHLIARAMRLCKLYCMGAPGILLRNEEQGLAAAYIIQKYGKNVMPVDDSVRLKIEAYLSSDSDEDDEDSQFTSYSMNTRKSMLPLFVYMIVTQQSDAENPLSQKDILTRLSDRPYEIVVERKAVGRIVHNLAEANLGIHVDKSGVWFEKIEI